MHHLIETERLYIRELLPGDVDGMFEMDTDPEVHKYVGQQPLSTRDEASAVIDFVRQQYAERGIGRWAVVDKATGEFLGWTGFKLMLEETNGHVNHYDYGYRLKRSAWGKGIATESGRASLHYGLQQLSLRPVYAMTDVNNAASRHVLEKLGFRYKGTFAFDKPGGWRTPRDLTATWYEWPHEQ